MLEGYDPEWIEFAAAAGSPNLPDDLDARREAFNASLVELAKQLPVTDPGVNSRDEQISSEVKIRIYTPPNSTGEQRPLLVFAHGGGWLSGNLDTEDHLCRILCSQVPCIVVSVDYRLFPGGKFPQPIDDCYAAYQWAYEHASELGADPTRFSIAGGSAGAALAVAVAYKLVSTGQSGRICGLVTIAGMYVHPKAVPEEYKHLHTSYVENSGQIPVVTGDDMLFAYDHIIGAENFANADWFPVSAGAKSLQGFPRTYIFNTDKEALRDDGRVLEAALEDAGVPVKRDNMPGLPHYFFCFPLKNAGDQFRRLLVQGVKWIVNADK